MVLPGIFGSPLVTIRNGSPPVCTSTVLIMRFSFMMRSILARELRAVAGSTYRLAPSSLSYTGSKCRPALVVDQPVSKFILQTGLKPVHILMSFVARYAFMASTSFALERAFRPKQIYEQVAERMRGEIRSGQFAPEARLPSERDLAARFGVGRPAVREALGALQNEGLVLTRRNSGTYVCADALQRLATAPGGGAAFGADADFSPTSALDVRLVLEPAIARRAAMQARRDEIAEHYLAQMDSLTDVTD